MTATLGFMDELVDILDENGNPTGKTCLKSEAHRKGSFHPTIHVWLYTANKELLFQQRAVNKDTFPSLWDVSVAGHIGAGENIEEAAVRETLEEIGLEITASELEKIGLFKSTHKHSEALIDNEFHHTFICKLKIPITLLTMQKSEVDALKLVGMPEFQSKLETRQLGGYVPHDLQYYKMVLQEISRRL